MIYHYNDTPIFYEVHGQGSPWVLLHGFLETSAIWERFITDFSKNHTIVSIDLPGHGASGCIAEIHTMELMAEVVAGVLGFLEINVCTFIGHSMGGYVALAYAEMFPKHIQKLVLLNSTPQEDSEERKESRSRVLRIIKTNREAFISMAITNLFANDTTGCYKGVIKKMKETAIRFPVQGITAAIKGMKDRKDRTKVLSTVKGRVYIITGVADPIMPVQDLEAISEQTNTPIFKVEGGHMSWVENYEKVKSTMHFIDK